MSVSIPYGTNDIVDGIFRAVRNGFAPYGSIQAMMARRIQYKQHQGRTLFHWWGGWREKGINFDVTGATVFRFARHNALEGGGRHLRMNAHVMQPKDPTASATSGINFDGHDNAFAPTADGAYYPDKMVMARGYLTDSDDDISTTVDETYIGFDNVRPVAGCVFEDQIRDMNPEDTVMDNQFAGGREVLATQTGSFSTMDRMRDRINHVHQNRNTQISWACPDDSYFEFNGSDYRYMFDQTIGDGGTAPSFDGPGITLPVPYAGYGIASQVRVYLYVYAAMSGTTDHGTVAVANKDATGAMGAMTPLVNGATISGTSYQWYPGLGALDPAAGAYFLSPTGIVFDRVCIGGRSEGTTDKLRVKAWTLVVFPGI